jgi:hypothetical protein
MNQQTITSGNNSVIINEQNGRVWANLYVGDSITALRWTGSTVAGAKRWAAKVLAA